MPFTVIEDHTAQIQGGMVVSIVLGLPLATEDQPGSRVEKCPQQTPFSD